MDQSAQVMTIDQTKAVRAMIVSSITNTAPRPRDLSIQQYPFPPV
jgi:hypothetical protein